MIRLSSHNNCLVTWKLLEKAYILVTVQMLSNFLVYTYYTVIRFLSLKFHVNSYLMIEDYLRKIGPPLLFPFVLVDLESLHSAWLTGAVHEAMHHTFGP